MKINPFHYICLILLMLLSGCRPAVSVYDLECEGLDSPLAIDGTCPHFSWKVRGADGTEISAYQILVASLPEKLNEEAADLWNSGKTGCGRQTCIAYSGRELSSRDMVYWKVRVWDQEDRPSAWSGSDSFGIGILSEDDWADGTAFIGMSPELGMTQKSGSKDGDSEVAPLFRAVFDADMDSAQLLLHINSLGYHEAYVNGRKVSDSVLNPAVSQLTERSVIMTYDVTSLVRKGENEIVIWAGRGWYQTHTEGIVPGGPFVRAELDAVYPEGYEALLVSDRNWRVAESGRRTFGTWRPHRMGGEIVDSRIILSDLSSKSLDALEWYPVSIPEIPSHKASPQMCEANVMTKSLHPVASHKMDDGSFVYDMGRSFVGFTEVLLPAVPSGNVVTLHYEDLGLDSMDKFRDGEYTDMFIGNGSGGMFSSKFNYKGYRYLKISGLDEELPLSSITGYPVRTAYDGKASFECSDKDMNDIYQMISNTLEALTLGGYMVDCPQVERLGYGGDGNASTPTLQTLFNVAPLYMNWMQAWADCQRENGDMPHTAPNPYMAGGGPFWCAFMISASWQTWLNYGDIRLIQRYYPNMQRWIDFAESNMRDGLLKEWGATEYRWWYLGDWATPEGIDQTDPLSVDIVSNCVLSDSYRTMAWIADVMGRSEEARDYMNRHHQLNDRIHSAFYNVEGRSYSTGTQIDLVYPMLVGATPESCEGNVRETLQNVTENRFNGHLATGLVGVPVLTQWATENAETEFIYKMLKKREYPGYLYMIDNGATLTWEHWNGARSQIHNCYNGIGSWFHQALAGIRPDPDRPGYRNVLISPQPVDGIDWVKAAKDTPYGVVKVSWEAGTSDFELSVEIPSGSTATVRMPDGTVLNIKSGRHTFKCNL